MFADLEGKFFSELGDLIKRRRVDAAAHRRECDGAIHRAGVEIFQPEAIGQRTRNSALAGSCRPIDGNDSHLPARPLRLTLAVAGCTLHADDGTFVKLGNCRRPRICTRRANTGNDLVDDVLDSRPIWIEVHA